MLALSGKELMITMSIILRALIENIGSIQEQIGNISREMETLRRIKDNS